ncbi:MULTISPECIES: YjbH domain-containing protein [Ramlibacter]|uniref:YjbH domain-containing protein n=1 Tax=Ramlibacter pinisoli TaxID=2682844 RepID=A0A6N8ISE3_9BURK|nr:MULTISPECIES: YjbH domain-containing protein [Ramlibacter]MBA2964809.1 YjbH domain-containing protein [Ramlibacter sp. CGMCC 1.13660]MVQ29774.1 hypothetical protein [Ramlibacter pinisoli]
MRAPKPTTLALAIGMTTLPAWAIDTTLTSAGFTGLGITPNAHLLGWGRMEVGYENQLPGNVRRPDGHNAVLGFGLLPNLEFAGRLATNTIHDNCFTSGCGARDLSASAKAGIGLDVANRWRVALGATDVGGSVTYFRTYYGVLTFNEGPFEASAGGAKRSGNGVNGSQAPLDGPFAALAWQPIPLVRGHVEYTDGNSWAGVRLFAPKQWMPDGWLLSAGANVRLNNNTLTERSWWSASLSIPLYKTPGLSGAQTAALPPLRPGEQPLPAYEARTVPAPQASTAAPALPPPVSLAPPAHPTPALTQTAASDDELRALANALQAKALEDIWVGRMPDGTLAIRVNNGSYQWNSADALGVALGVIGRSFSEHKAGFRLVLTQRQVPLVAVTGQADCLRQWIEQATSTCTAGQLSTPGTLPLEPLYEGAAWVVERQKPASKTLRLSVSPVLRTNFGTELGAYDYSVGVNVTAQLPLWAGASVEWGLNAPLANSNDYEPGGVFADRAVKAGTERLTLTQVTRVPLERWFSPSQKLGAMPGALTAQATVGRIGTFYDGVVGALRWEPGDGRHRVSGQAGYFQNNDSQGGFGPLGSFQHGGPVLGSYRFSFLPTRTDFEGTVGQFLNNDRGFQLTMRQWFTDVAVDVFYKRTTFPGQSAAQLVGVQLSLPIGPRRDWQPAPYLQVGGTPRFSHLVETTIREGAGNPLRLGHAVRTPAQDLNDYFNSDRSGLAWFEDNLRRVRDAAR